MASDAAVERKAKELDDINNEISKIRDRRCPETKKFTDTSLNLMETCLKTYKDLIYATTLDLAEVVIGLHYDVIVKKVLLLNDYLEKNINIIGTVIEYNNWEYINRILKEKNIIIELNEKGELEQGIIEGVTVGESTNMNIDNNYTLNVEKRESDGFVTYRVTYITYKFTNRIELINKKYEELKNNKKTVDKKEVYNGKLEDLKLIGGWFTDEIEKEELDIEEDINIFRIEEISEYKTEIDILNKILNEPYTRKLTKKEQYRTPVLSKIVKEGYEIMKKELPPENVLVEELVVDGYRERINNNKFNIDSILEEVTKLEESIEKFKNRLEKSYTSDGTDEKNSKDNKDGKPKVENEGIPLDKNNTSDPDVQKINELEKERDKVEKELIELSPQAAGKSKLILLILQILLFPILLILSLIGDLFGGIIEFITGLPLLKFGKIIEFFESLIKLPSKKGFVEKITSTIQDIVEIPESALESVTDIVDGVSGGVAEISDKYIEENILDSLPFNLPPIVKEEEEEEEEKEVKADMEDINYDEDYGFRNVDGKFYNGEYYGPSETQNRADYEKNYDKPGSSPSSKPATKKPDDTVKKVFDNTTSSKALGLLLTLHPKYRQRTVLLFEEMIHDLGTKYGSQGILISTVYRSYAYQADLFRASQIPAEAKKRGIKRAARPGGSWHEAGLAVDMNVLNGSGGIINSGFGSSKAFQYVINRMKTDGWKWHSTKDYVHWDLAPLIGGSARDLLDKSKKIKDSNGRIYPDLS